MKHCLYPEAMARIQGGEEYPQLRGTAKFFQRHDGVMVEAEVTGLPDTQAGFLGFHIHEGGSCDGEGFPETGGHYNPGKGPHPDHAGDLPPLLSCRGTAYMKVFTDRFRVEDVVEKTVIIHSNPDDFRTQPSGNAGTKIACGVIEKM